jgi:hypothetical protein
MPVDYEVCPTRQDAAITVPNDLMKDIAPRARASVAVFKDTGSEWVPESYTRSPWAVIRAKQREVMLNAFFIRNTTVTNFQELTLGTMKSLLVVGAGGNTFNNLNPTYSLRWGTNNTAATNSDHRLNVEADQFAPATTLFDTATFTNVLGGSNIYTGAPVNLQELGVASQQVASDSTTNIFLFDRAVVAPVAVATNRTVAIEYVWQF